MTSFLVSGCGKSVKPIIKDGATAGGSSIVEYAKYAHQFSKEYSVEVIFGVYGFFWVLPRVYRYFKHKHGSSSTSSSIA